MKVWVSPMFVWLDNWRQSHCVKWCELYATNRNRLWATLCD